MKFEKSTLNFTFSIILVICLVFSASVMGIAAPTPASTGTSATGNYTLRIGSDILSVDRDGVKQSIQLDAVPVIVGSRAFLPVRQVIEAMGGTLTWDQEEDEVGISVGSNSINLWVGESYAVRNGERVLIDPNDSAIMPFIAPPGRVMLPIRFVAESSGATVDWNSQTETILIQYNQSAATATPNPTPVSTSPLVGDFAFDSGIDSYNKAYEKASKVITSDIKGGKFFAGSSWAQVWTRDSSYSIDLALGLTQPTVSKTTLMGMTQNISGIGDCWLQDVCGHFKGWPNLTDAIVGATGAWSYYKTSGDNEFLKWSYDVTVNSLKRAERDVYDSESGLFKGCSSFMESNSGYPKAYKGNGPAVAQTKALSTNMLYYNGYIVAEKMGQILGKDTKEFSDKADKLKLAINNRLWMPDKGYYAYFEDKNGVKDTRMEGLGESFAILFGVADAEKTASILKNTPTTNWGIACLWPQYEEWMTYPVKDTASYYHNGMIWPFVQGYWAWAASDNKNVDKFKYELEKLVALSEKNDTFMEFYLPENGAPGGSRSQLWSASGYLSMIYHGLFGMNFETDGIYFKPVVPDTFKNLRLQNIKYREMTLNITVSGSGTKVKSFKLDGNLSTNYFTSKDLKGNHSIEIVLE